MTARFLSAITLAASAFLLYGEDQVLPGSQFDFAGALKRFHISGKAPDDIISRRAWTNLLDKCDRERKFFLPSDIKELESEADRLDDMLAAGDFSFASRVRMTYLKRLEQAAANSSDEILKSRLKAERLRPSSRNNEDFLSAIASAYDPHTEYLSPARLNLFNSHMFLSMCGIGVSIKLEGEYVKVREIIPGSPLSRDGRVRQGDRILSVSQNNDGNFIPVAGMDELDIIMMIQGKKGCEIAMEIEHSDGKRETVAVKRDNIFIEDQSASSRVVERCLPEGKVVRLGILRLPAFYVFAPSTNSEFRTSHIDVRRELKKLSSARVDGVLLDLRSNGGGSLEDAVRIIGYFVRSGPAVRMCSRSGETSVNVIEGEAECEVPVVVFVDSISASASELVSATLQDTGRAVVIGDERTFGKGSSQMVVSLGGGVEGSLSVTSGRFYRITGASTQLKGVSADIVVKSDIPAGISEASQKYPLEWNHIDPVDFVPSWDLGKFVPELRRASAERNASAEKKDKHAALDEAVSILADLVRLNDGRTLPQASSMPADDDSCVLDDIDDE